MCLKDISTVNMGEVALESHVKKNPPEKKPWLNICYNYKNSFIFYKQHWKLKWYHGKLNFFWYSRVIWEKSKINKEIKDFPFLKIYEVMKLSGAFRSGVKISGWHLKKVMRSIQKLFYNSIKKNIYIQINKTEHFAKSFCCSTHLCSWQRNQSLG